MTITTNMTDHTPANRVNPYGMTMIKFGEGATLNDVVEQADLNYTVRKIKKVVAVDEDGTALTIPGKHAIVADHEGQTHGITTTGNRYQPIQHLETLDKINPLVREGFMRYSHAGRDGYGKVFVLYTLNEDVSLVGDYPHVRQLMFSTAHDGTGAWRWRPWTTDLFCTNQRGMIFSRRGRSMISMRHSGRDFTDSIHDMVISLMEVYQYEDDMLGALSRRVVGSKQVEEFVETLIPDPKRITTRLTPYVDLDRGDKRAFTSIVERRNALRGTIMASPTMNTLRDPWETTIPAHVLVHGAVEWSDYLYNSRMGEKGRAQRILNGTDMPWKRLAAQTALRLAGITG